MVSYIRRMYESGSAPRACVEGRAGRRRLQLSFENTCTAVKCAETPAYGSFPKLIVGFNTTSPAPTPCPPPPPVPFPTPGLWSNE